MHDNQVGVWRQRFEADGMAGLLDEDRPGRPPVYGPDDVRLLVKTVTEDPPDAATGWTLTALAERMAAEGVAISASQAWRICRALDLKPWQEQSWMTSHAPDLWEKLAYRCLTSRMRTEARPQLGAVAESCTFAFTGHGKKVEAP